MLTVMIVGLAMGATVMIGRAIGAQKQEQAARAIGNTITLFMVIFALKTKIPPQVHFTHCGGIF